MVKASKRGRYCLRASGYYISKNNAHALFLHVQNSPPTSSPIRTYVHGLRASSAARGSPDHGLTLFAFVHSSFMYLIFNIIFSFLSSPSLLLFPLLRLYIDTRKRFTFHIMERTNSLPFGSKSTTLVGKSCRGSINFRFHLYGPAFFRFFFASLLTQPLWWLISIRGFCTDVALTLTLLDQLYAQSRHVGVYISVKVLPHGLPGIFEARSTERSHAHIKYKVHTECDVKGFFKRDICHHQQLVVQQRLLSTITGIQTSAEEVPHTNYPTGFFGGGEGGVNSRTLLLLGRNVVHGTPSVFPRFGSTLL